MSKRPSVEFTNIQVVPVAEAISFISKDMLVEKHLRKRSKNVHKDGSITHFLECTFDNCPKQHKVFLPISQEEKATMLESNNAHDHSSGIFTVLTLKVCPMTIRFAFKIQSVLLARDQYFACTLRLEDFVGSVKTTVPFILMQRTRS